MAVNIQDDEALLRVEPEHPALLKAEAPQFLPQEESRPEVQVLPDNQQIRYSQLELDAAIEDAIDRDRVSAFLAFTSCIDPNKGVSLVSGTSLQALSIARALRKSGYK